MKKFSILAICAMILSSGYIAMQDVLQHGELFSYAQTIGYGLESLIPGANTPGATANNISNSNAENNIDVIDDTYMAVGQTTLQGTENNDTIDTVEVAIIDDAYMAVGSTSINEINEDNNEERIILALSDTPQAVGQTSLTGIASDEDDLETDTIPDTANNNSNVIQAVGQTTLTGIPSDETSDEDDLETDTQATESTLLNNYKKSGGSAVGSTCLNCHLRNQKKQKNGGRTILEPVPEPIDDMELKKQAMELDKMLERMQIPQAEREEIIAEIQQRKPKLEEQLHDAAPETKYPFEEFKPLVLPNTGSLVK